MTHTNTFHRKVSQPLSLVTASMGHWDEAGVRTGPGLWVGVGLCNQREDDRNAVWNFLNKRICKRRNRKKDGTCNRHLSPLFQFILWLLLKLQRPLTPGDLWASSQREWFSAQLLNCISFFFCFDRRTVLSSDQHFSTFFFLIWSCSFISSTAWKKR